MKQSTTMMLGAGALLGSLAFSPVFAEILVESSDDSRNVLILLDRETNDGVITREYYDGSTVSIDEENTNGHILRMIIDDGRTVSTCVRLENDEDGSPLTCLTNEDDDTSDEVFYSYTGDDDISIRQEIREAMREHEREMAEFEREMAELERELADEDGILAGLSEVAAELAHMAANLETTVMASLAESGIRIESDHNGNEVVWVQNDDEDEPSMRVVTGSGGENLVFMYYDGFENDYHYVIENSERGGDNTTIHAYDVSTVEVRESSRHDGHLETETTRDGGPHLTIHTDDPDHVRVVRLDRSRFDG